MDVYTVLARGIIYGDWSIMNYKCVSSIQRNLTATTAQHREGDVESWRSFAWPRGEVSVDLKFSSHVDYGELVVQVKF